MGPSQQHALVQVSDPARHALDTLSVSAVVVALLEVLPVVLTTASTFLAIVWMLIRIYETPTVQAWLKTRRRR